MPDFDLQQLVEVYLDKISPAVKFEELDRSTGKIVRTQVSILYWYVRFQEMLEAGTEAAKKYREELFGVGELEATPELYADYDFYRALNLSERGFHQLDLHEQARLKAHYILQGLVELRKAHLRLMKQKREAWQARIAAESEKKKP